MTGHYAQEITQELPDSLLPHRRGRERGSMYQYSPFVDTDKPPPFLLQLLPSHKCPINPRTKHRGDGMSASQNYVWRPYEVPLHFLEIKSKGGAKLCARTGGGRKQIRSTNTANGNPVSFLAGQERISYSLARFLPERRMHGRQ